MTKPGSDSFLIDGWRVSPLEGTLTRGDETLHLEPRAMEVLCYFASRPGEVIAREELERDVWQGALVGYDAVSNTVIKLRKAFGDDARHPRIIQTVPKRGYRLLAEVRQGTPAGSETSSSMRGEMSDDGSMRSRRHWLAGMAAILGMVALSLLIFEYWPSPAADPGGNREPARLVVLPFKNLSEDAGQDYFSNGLTDDLITELSGIPGLAVIANDSAFVYQGNESPGRLREELDIHYVLRGSVRKEAGRVRINVRLIEAVEGRHLWAQRYEEKLADTFALQDAIVERIATSLKVSMRGSGELSQRYRAGIEAYDHFLRGKVLYGQRTRSDLQASEHHFRKAVELDPDFARAHAALALVYLRDVMDGWSADPSAALQQAQAQANRAIALDAALPEAHFVKAVIALFLQHYRQAIEELDQAIKLRPSYADAYATLAWVLHFAGRPREGRPHLDTAMQLNPHLSAPYLLIDGGMALTQGQVQRAINSLEQAREMSPTHPRVLLWLAAAYARADRVEEASWVIQELRMQHPTLTFTRLDNAFPFQNSEILQELKDALRKAGLAPVQ